MAVAEFSYAGATITTCHQEAGYEGSKMFDNSAASLWNHGGTPAYPAYVTCDFGAGSPHIVTKYTLQATASGGAYMPTAWKLQGSNDNSNWTDLDSRTGQSFSNAELKTFDPLSSAGSEASFRYYRLYMSAGSAVALQIAEEELWGDDAPATTGSSSGIGMGSANMMSAGC
jgi:hypothetical protein